MPTKPKPPTQIEVWRHEVSAAAPQHNYTPTEAVYHSPPITPPSFWKKTLRRLSNPPLPNPNLSQNQNPAILLPPNNPFSSTSTTSKIKKKLKGEVDEDSGGGGEDLRTEMYDRTPSPTQRRKVSLMIPGDVEDRDRASSLEVASAESEDDVLKRKRERLERAARLLRQQNRVEDLKESGKRGDG